MYERASSNVFKLEATNCDIEPLICSKQTVFLDDLSLKRPESLILQKPKEPVVIKTSSTSKYGQSTRSDMKIFDDKYALGRLLNYKIHKVIFHYGSYVPAGVINGIQLYYKNIYTGNVVKTVARYGRGYYTGYEEFTLEDDEYITDFYLRSGDIVDCIKLTTNKGRILTKGGNGGSLQFEGFSKKVMILGTMGSYSEYLYNFGVHYLEGKAFEYFTRRLYFLLRSRIKKDTALVNKVAPNSGNYDLAVYAFGKLCTLEDKIFLSAIKYLRP